MNTLRPILLSRLPTYWLVFTAIAILSGCSFLEPTDEPSLNTSETIQSPSPSRPVPVTPVPAPVPTLAVTASETARVDYIQALLTLEETPLNQETVGYYMDIQYASLQQKLNNNLATLARRGDEISITLHADLVFESGSANINPSAVLALNLIVDVLNEYNKTLIEVTAHTDEQENNEYSQQLTELQGLAIGQHFTNRDVDLNRLLIMAFGSSRPLSSNQSPLSRAQNRRVELILLPVIASPD